MGSKHLVKNPPRPIEDLRLMVNLDMIGRPRFLDRKSLWILKKAAGVSTGPGVGLLGADEREDLRELAREACTAEGLAMVTLSDFPRLAPVIQGMTENRDDSASFRKAGVQTLFFSTSENDDYHRVTDTIDKVDPEVMLKITRAAWRTVLAFDASTPAAGD